MTASGRDDSATLRRLVRLRLMLASARLAASDTTALGRLRAVIELDGVCESAIGIALDDLTVDPKRRDFRQKVDLLSEAIPGWGAPGQRGVMTLHVARNQAQHHGVVPDADEITGWVTEVDRFVRSLVTAAQGLSLEQVHASDAIEDPRLREQVAEAERELDERDPAASFESSWDALRAARRRWQVQRARHGQRISPRSFTRTTDRLAKELHQGVEALEEFVEISVFASDFGEYVWLSAQYREARHRAKPTVEDARRALVFVLNWVLRWESFNARFPEDRWERWWDDQEAPTTGLDHPRPVIIDVQRTEPRLPDHSAFLFQLADVPRGHQGPYALTRWDGPFYAAFDDVQGDPAPGMPKTVRAFINPGGQLSVEVPTNETVDASALVDFVERIIARTQERYLGLSDAQGAVEARNEQLAEPYRELVGALNRPDVEINSVRAQVGASEPRDGPTEDQIIVGIRMPEGVSSIELENIIRMELGFEELRGHTNELWFPREQVTPAEIRDIVSKGAERLSRKLGEDQRSQGEREHRAKRLLGELRETLRARTDAARTVD